MDNRKIASELVKVAKELVGGGLYPGQVVPVGGRGVDPNTDEALEQLGFTPKVEFSIVTEGTTIGGRPTRKRYTTQLHFTQYSPDRYYLYGRDTYNDHGFSGGNPLLFLKAHWDSFKTQYMNRIDKALKYHFPVERNARRQRMAGPYNTWVEVYRQRVYDFGDRDDFTSRDVVGMFEALKNATAR